MKNKALFNKCAAKLQDNPSFENQQMAATNLVLTMFGNQLDTVDLPVVEHSLRVGEQAAKYGKTRAEAMTLHTIGLLHDIVEDTDVTILDLNKMGFTQHVVGPVGLLTHITECKSYERYIETILLNTHASIVKLCDVMDNLQRPRPKKFKTKQKLEALHFLSLRVAEFVNE